MNYRGCRSSFTLTLNLSNLKTLDGEKYAMFVHGEISDRTLCEHPNGKCHIVVWWFMQFIDETALIMSMWIREERKWTVSVYLSTRLLENQGIIGHLIFNTGLIAEYQNIDITELGYSIVHEISQKPSMTSVNAIILCYTCSYYSAGYKCNYYTYLLNCWLLLPFLTFYAHINTNLLCVSRKKVR